MTRPPSSKGPGAGDSVTVTRGRGGPSRTGPARRGMIQENENALGVAINPGATTARRSFARSRPLRSNLLALCPDRQNPDGGGQRSSAPRFAKLGAAGPGRGHRRGPRRRWATGAAFDPETARADRPPGAKHLRGRARRFRRGPDLRRPPIEAIAAPRAGELSGSPPIEPGAMLRRPRQGAGRTGRMPISNLRT